MKTRSYKLIPLKAYAIALLLLCAAIAFVFSKTRQANTPVACSTVIKTAITLDNRSTHGLILVNTVPIASNQMKILLSGKIEEGDKAYTVSRELVLRYRYSDTYHPMTLEKSINRVRDTVAQAELEKLFPQQGQYLHMKINRIDENTYVFSDNYSPIFICTTN